MSNGSSTMMKLMLIGDSAVGKTSILGRFSDDKFDISHITTIGIDFKTKEIELRGQKVKLQVWDTAGQERFQTITHQYYRGATGIVLVYDITNGKSFSNIERWLRKIEEHASENVVKVIVGNKSDRTDKRVVSRERGETMAMEHGVCFYETSAKLNENIDKVFFELAETILAESETNAVDEPNRETVVPGEMSNSLQERIGGRCCY